MNSTNAMPISSTKKATESYSSQCRPTVIMSFPSTAFFFVENRWARQSDLDVDQKIAVVRDSASSGSYQCPLSTSIDFLTQINI
jgi:hypothetical protein